MAAQLDGGRFRRDEPKSASSVDVTLISPNDEMPIPFRSPLIAHSDFSVSFQQEHMPSLV